MLGSFNVLSGTDLSTGAIVLTVFLTGIVLAVVAGFGVIAFRRAGDAGLSGQMWRGSLVLVGVLLAVALLGRSPSRDQDAERRALEARTAELTIRAIQPGSALACLDAVAAPAVEAACEKSVFATPEMVAAAVSYVDARVSLLSLGAGLAERDQAFRPSFERLRRALEADRFGIVSHVLMTRGCNGTDCPDLKLVRDNSRILSGMRSRTFDAHVSIHSLAWNPGAAVAVSTAAGAGGPSAAGLQANPVAPLASTSAAPPAVAAAPLASDPTLGSGTIVPAQPFAHAAGTAPGQAKYDFPSAASIPAVSIMTPEPSTPPAAEQKPAAKPAPRRQAAPRNQAPPHQAATPAPPQQIAPPPPAPPAQAPPPPPQTSGSR